MPGTTTQHSDARVRPYSAYPSPKRHRACCTLHESYYSAPFGLPFVSAYTSNLT